MKPILIALIFAVGTIAASAQTNDSLDALISTALANNPEIAMAHRKWDAALQKIPQARALDDPTAPTRGARARGPSQRARPA